jgi:hypothetical protein
MEISMSSCSSLEPRSFDISAASASLEEQSFWPLDHRYYVSQGWNMGQHCMESITSSTY